MLEQFWSSVNRKTGTHWAVFWQSFAFTITSSNSASSLPSKSWKYQLWKSERPKNMADMAFSRYIRETNLVPLSKLKVETHLSKPGIWNPFSFLSSHIFLLYIYINSHTHSNTYAVHQNRMLSLHDVARHGYRFGRKSSFLECITPWSEPQMQQLHQALHWCSQRSGRPWAGMCNIPVKHPCSTGWHGQEAAWGALCIRDISW